MSTKRTPFDYARHMPVAYGILESLSPKMPHDMESFNKLSGTLELTVACALGCLAVPEEREQALEAFTANVRGLFELVETVQSKHRKVKAN